MDNPKPLVVANLKANKTWDLQAAWLDEVGNSNAARSFTGTVIVCPAHPFLAACAQKIRASHLPLLVGTQDISKFSEGAYTGEFAASQIADFCQYAVIGHSERRRNFGESEDDRAKKVALCKKAGIEPIFCVQDEREKIPKGVVVVAYEPLFAVGTGNPDSPDNAHSVARRIKEKGPYTVIYGGSVTHAIVATFLARDIVDGVLIGVSNSLDPQKFIPIIGNARY